ncbi:restriction endonuclease subunit S [Capnocytophaga gingivalis]|uniref:restriction endonuclease subunit S n=2 Tax=Capnocytophaga gingivalis TaxID=1017 RepID=UPI00288927DA|nr:restriction endonuclease subunit S [Capnocytophaga gingivalis]
MNTKQIRQKILDLAIRGELVPQDPTDEPASVLLERIRAEKEQLIKDKKLKRDKKDNEPIDEVPFELPEGWEWCRLGEIAYIAAGSTPESSSFVNKGIPYLKVYNLRNQAIDFDYKPQYIKESIHNGILKRSKTEIGDLIMNIVGPPLGKLAIIPTSLPESNFNQAAVLIRPYLYKNIINKYLFYFLSEMSEINSISTKGSAGQINISLSQSKNIRVPFPPLAEQERIAQKVEQLLTIVDTIELLKEQLKALVKQTKNQVLNYAIAGKLTHQDPNDEPAEELLKRIGKTTAADTPYEKLPKGWAWCRLGDCFEWGSGGTPKSTIKEYYDGDIPWLVIGDLNDSYINSSERTITKLGLQNSSAKLVPKGTLLIAMYGSIGKLGIANRELATNQAIAFALENEINMKYLFYYLLSIRSDLNRLGKGATQLNISQTVLKSYPFPLPPLAEQHRIVQQIESYFTAFDQIENELA